MQHLVVLTWTAVAIALLNCLGGDASLINDNRRLYIEAADEEPIYDETLPRFLLDKYGFYSDKRGGGGLDFGLGRGASGAQLSKYRLGLLAAESPEGPGRRRRSGTPTH